MGLKFSSPVTRNFLCLIMVDLVIIGACIFPVVPVSSSQVLFEFKGYNIGSSDYAYRWFEIGRGQEVRIDYWCDQDVEAYLFTESQFIEYSSNGASDSLRTLKMVPTGKIDKSLDASGLHFFVIRNPNKVNTTIIFSQCTGSTIERVTIAQKIREYCFESGLISKPSITMVREKPGVGSFA